MAFHLPAALAAGRFSPGAGEERVEVESHDCTPSSTTRACIYPRIAVVAETGSSAGGGFAIEIDSQPLVTHESESFCRRVEHYFHHPRYDGRGCDEARLVAERIRRWTMR